MTIVVVVKEFAVDRSKVVNQCPKYDFHVRKSDTVIYF